MAAVYFAYLAVVAVARLKLRPAALSIATALLIVFVGMPHIMPLAYLLLGYWLPAMIVGKPSLRFEERLLDIDRKLFGTDGLARFERNAPLFVTTYLELAYLACYAVVPAGYAGLLLAGHGADDIDRFWSIVLLASFVCYGLLPWIPTRAPRIVEQGRGLERSSIRQANIAVLNRASVQWNTFPSGHTAASVATALAVSGDMPLAGLVLGIVAVSIAAGSVVGRYHYAADALAGALVAMAAFAMGNAAHGP